MNPPPVFRNWSDTVVARPTRYVQPRTEDELVELVRDTHARGGRLRIVGAGHSWSDAAACQDTMVNLDRLDRVVEVDAQASQVTVQAGIRIRELIVELERRGLALANVGSIAEQSIAGAIGTGTHGTGLAYGSLSTQLVRFRLVTGQGEVRTVTPESDEALFYAGAVSFGALGVMTQVTLQVEPTYDIEESAFAMPFRAALRLAPQLYREHPRLKFWWLPHTGQVQVFTYDETDRPRAPVSSLADRYDRFMNERVFALVLGLGGRLPGRSRRSTGSWAPPTSSPTRA